MTSFTRKRIQVVFRLGLGTFGDSGFDTVTIDGARVHCSITSIPAPTKGQAEIRIYGLEPDKLHRLSALNEQVAAEKMNAVAVYAGDTDPLALIFQGQIRVGQIMYNQQPETPLFVLGIASGLQAVQSTDPISYPGSVAVADILQSIAAKNNMDFANFGVTMQLRKPYFTGSPEAQANAVALAGRGVFKMLFDKGDPATNRGRIVIWPEDGRRDPGEPILTISPETGMIGYPDYATGIVGVHVSTLFNPLISVGGLVNVQSSVLSAGKPILCKCFNVEHHLQSQTPGGEWRTSFDAQLFAGS